MISESIRYNLNNASWLFSTAQTYVNRTFNAQYPADEGGQEFINEMSLLNAVYAADLPQIITLLDSGW